MTETLLEAQANLQVAQDAMNAAIERYAQAIKEWLGPQLPDVPDDDTLASLGRFANDVPGSVTVRLESELARVKLELTLARRHIRDLEAGEGL